MNEPVLLTAKTHADREYWKGRVGPGAGSMIPLDFPRPIVFARHRASVAMSVAGAPFDALAAIAADSPFLMYAAVVAAVKVAVYRFTGIGSVVTGSPCYLDGDADRAVNAVPIVDEILEHETFGDLLIRVSETLQNAYAHQDYPFAAVVADSGQSSEPARCALFDIGVRLGEIHGSFPDLPTDVSIELTRQDRRIDGTVWYNPKLFRDATMQRFARLIEAVLTFGLEHRDDPIEAIDGVSAHDRQTIESWTTTAGPQARLLAHQAFVNRARQKPDAIALVHDSEHVTYRELRRRSGLVAERLTAAGIGLESLVATWQRRSPETVAQIIGVLRAGAAYVPVDSTQPLERASGVLSDASPALVLIDSAREPLRSVPTLVFDEWKGSPRTSPDERRVHADNLAYVFYTSGSTGRPKGVAMPHGPLANLIEWQNELSSATDERTLQYARLDFDVSFQEIFATLAAGATLVIAPDDARTDPAALVKLLRDEAVTRAFLPVVALGTLAAEAASAVERFALREVITAGEQLQISPSIVRMFRALPQCVLRNQYGPTEAHVVTSQTLAPPSSRWPALPDIGRPIGNATTHVLDPLHRRLPIGGRGMLFIGGVPLSRGYWRAPDLTALAFVPDPFGSTGSRIYTTGDLARYTADGSLEFHGRADRQLKIRGYRIEPAEVEAALRSHPDVRDVAVTSFTGAAGQKGLVAYVVPIGRGLAADAYRAFLERKLPEPMIPSRVVMMDILPLTSSGKIDRGRLPAPDTAGLDEHTALRREPRTEKEVTLARIWAETLAVAAVGVDDNFFALGGDSILAIQVVSKARQHGLRLIPRQLFQHQTVQALAEVADVTSAARSTRTSNAPAPVTPIQQWFFDQRSPNPNHFNMAYLFALSDRVSSKVVAAAVARVLEHHSALRLRFHHSGVGWTQQESAPNDGPLPFTVVDLSVCPDEDIAERIRSETSRLGTMLDLAAGPVFRAALFELGPTRGQRLFTVAHHLVVDSVSWRILQQDLHASCQPVSNGHPPALPAASTPFTEWAARQHEHAQSAAVMRELAYWKESLRSPVPTLPVDNPAGDNCEQDARVVNVRLDEEQTHRLLRDALRGGRRINDLLLTALARAFRAWTGSRDLAVDVEGHGRESFDDELDVTRTVGWFTVLAPLRLSLSASGEVESDLALIAEQIARLPNHGIGYGLLRYLNRDERVRAALAAGPASPISFNYLGQFEHLAAEAPLLVPATERIGRLAAAQAHRVHELYINGFVRDKTLLTRFTYSGQRFQTATIEQLAHYFLDELREVIACSVVDRRPTPTDFPLARLERGQLDDVLANVRFGGEPVS